MSDSRPANAGGASPVGVRRRTLPMATTQPELFPLFKLPGSQAPGARRQPNGSPASPNLRTGLRPKCGHAPVRGRSPAAPCGLSPGARLSGREVVGRFENCGGSREAAGIRRRVRQAMRNGRSQSGRPPPTVLSVTGRTCRPSTRSARGRRGRRARRSCPAATWRRWTISCARSTSARSAGTTACGSSGSRCNCPRIVTGRTTSRPG